MKTLFTVSLGVALAVWAGPINAQDPDYEVSLSSATVVPGQDVEIALFVTNSPLELGGFGLGVCNDGTLLQLFDVGFGTALQKMNGGSRGSPEPYCKRNYCT